MKKEEIFCEYCGNECVVETFGVDDYVEYCPLCGKNVEEEKDEFEDEVDWEE